MGDPPSHTHSRRPSLPPIVIAGSAAVAHTIPLHEAYLIEQQAQSRSLEEGVELHSFTEEFDTPSDDNDDISPSSSMPAKKAKKKASSSSLVQSNTSSLDMNGGSFHERRKHPHTQEIFDDDSADARDRLMGRNTFSLDQPPPQTPGEEQEESSNGFFELPVQDRRNFLLLVLLYFLQGIPMGLAGGSVPFLLKSHLSYSQIGVYSLASYPYSLKLLWSPIVDAWWSAKVGLRKSWIIPIQMLSGFGMLWLGTRCMTGTGRL
jgi:hypothetical protein